MLLLTASSLAVNASTLTRADRLSPLAAGYLERARIMLSEGNYAGVVDQLKHLDTDHTDLPASERQEYAYLLALSLYERGDADCVDLLRQFADMYPASPQALPARLAAADYYFFAKRYAEALVAYSDIDRDRINPAQQPLYDYRRALCMLRTGHWMEARPIFTSLETHPDYRLAAEYYLAYCDYVEGEGRRAYEGFSHVAEAGGNGMEEGLEPEYYLAQIDFVMGNYGKAAEIARALLESNPDPELRPEMERVAGISLFKLGEEKTAERYLRLYLRHEDITPSDDAIYALGVIEYNKGELDSASDRFSRLTDLENELSQSAYLYLGQIAVRENDSNAAAISFEKASRMNFDPDVTEAALYNYIAARTRGGNIPFSSSIPMFREFLRRFPSSSRASDVEQYLATAYFNERDYARALESVNRISSPDRETLGMKQKILYQLGVKEMSNNRPEAARNYLRESVSVGGDLALKAQANLWLGDADYALGRYGEAEKAYQAYLKGDRRGENRAVAQYNLAYALLMQDKYAQSAKAFEEALRSTPRLPLRMHEDALIRMADAQYYAGDYRQALNNYTSAIENKAADADYATFRRAVMYGLGGDIRMKLSELSALSTRFPGSKWIPNALLEKGQTYTSLGETANAVTAFEQLRNSYRQSAEARRGMLSLALAYMKEQNTERATATYREIIEKWPSSEEARLANEDLRSHYARTGELGEYAAFLRGVSGAPQLDPSEMETLAFEGAETAYASDSADITLLERYVRDYPDGANLAQALLDIATGRDGKGDSAGAIDALDRLLAIRGDSPQVPEALLLRAEILEKGGGSKRRDARDAWRELEQRGGTEYAADAYAGIMRTTDNDSERLRYATLVRNSGGLSADLLEEAEFYEATAGLSAGKKDAEATLRRLAANPASLIGARAAVTLGQHYLDVGNVADAERVLTAFTDAGSPHGYWLARGFIALADVCEKRGKRYLAVEYLKSLRDNYPGDELDIHDMISTRLKKWK